MIRLAFGPDINLQNLILKAKTHFGLPSNSIASSPSTLSSPSPFKPISRPNPLSVPLHHLHVQKHSANGIDVTIPSSPSPNPWPRTAFSTTPSLSYANVVKETSDIGPGSFLSSPLPYNSSDLIDDHYPLQDHLAFLDDSKIDDLLDLRLDLTVNPGAYVESFFHARSYLAPAGVSSRPEDASSGLGWKPCLYFARGICKNDSSRRYLYADSLDTAAIVGSPSKLNELKQCESYLDQRQPTSKSQSRRRSSRSELLTNKKKTHRLYSIQNGAFYST